jgi:hypothetical protein
MTPLFIVSGCAVFPVIVDKRKKIDRQSGAVADFGGGTLDDNKGIVLEAPQHSHEDTGQKEDQAQVQGNRAQTRIPVPVARQTDGSPPLLFCQRVMPARQHPPYKLLLPVNGKRRLPRESICSFPVKDRIPHDTGFLAFLAQRLAPQQHTGQDVEHERRHGAYKPSGPENLEKAEGFQKVGDIPQTAGGDVLHPHTVHVGGSRCFQRDLGQKYAYKAENG